MQRCRSSRSSPTRGSATTRMFGITSSVTRWCTRTVGQRAILERAHAVVGEVPRDLGEDVHHLGELRARERAVEDEHVVRVHDVLVRLEPVAVHERRSAGTDAVAVRDHTVAGARSSSDVVAREQRLLVGRTQVREHHAVALLHRVPRLSVAVAMEPVLGLARLVEAHALRVEQPAVVAASDADVLDLAVEQRRAAMHATRVDEARVAAEVAEQDQVFAEHANLPRAGRSPPRESATGCQYRRSSSPPGVPASTDTRSWSIGSRRTAVRAAVVRRGCACHARIVSPDGHVHDPRSTVRGCGGGGHGTRDRPSGRRDPCGSRRARGVWRRRRCEQRRE